MSGPLWGGGGLGREKLKSFQGNFVCATYTVFKPLLCLQEPFSGDKHLLISASGVVFFFFPINFYMQDEDQLNLLISVQITTGLLPVSAYIVFFIFGCSTRGG